MQKISKNTAKFNVTHKAYVKSDKEYGRWLCVGQHQRDGIDALMKKGMYESVVTLTNHVNGEVQWSGKVRHIESLLPYFPPKVVTTICAYGNRHQDMKDCNCVERYFDASPWLLSEICEMHGGQGNLSELSNDYKKSLAVKCLEYIEARNAEIARKFPIPKRLQIHD